MLILLQRHPPPHNCPADNSNNHKENMLINRPFGARHLVPTPLRPSQHQVTGPLGPSHFIKICIPNVSQVLLKMLEPSGSKGGGRNR